ncbi:hypothetical protein AQUCO_06000031v1 [Aquilegia coerulea]|uniref:Uncharacterized protein n=1 Tax=Aquilegia coerulea TaxID=218851 RepID=A0A2G5CEW3_AQUCA|nr:hypothetical protein AQUCO_06000031v1 [Aquilegia coerulea]
MEVIAKEEKGILGNIRAPRLEDAGLEDCALSPKSIKEAFFKAANSIRYFVTNDDEEEEEEEKSCVQDPRSTDFKSDDSLIGISPAPDPPGPCGNEKGFSVNGGLMGDEVGVGVKGVIEDEGFDKLLGSDEVTDDKKACVDGLEGLKINGDEKRGVQNDEDDEKDDEPILVEAII